MIDDSTFGTIVFFFLGTAMLFLSPLSEIASELQEFFFAKSLAATGGAYPHSLREVQSAEKSRAIVEGFYVEARDIQRQFGDNIAWTVAIAAVATSTSLAKPLNASTCLCDSFLLATQVVVLVVSGLWAIRAARLFASAKRRAREARARANAE